MRTLSPSVLHGESDRLMGKMIDETTHDGSQEARLWDEAGAAFARYAPIRGALGQTANGLNDQLRIWSREAEARLSGSTIQPAADMVTVSPAPPRKGMFRGK
jgi:hypothetical protein